MSLHTSDDSEYCSDFSCDSLILSGVGRGEDCEIVPSTETSNSVNDANDAPDAEVIEADSHLPWYDATETFLRTTDGNNMAVDDSPYPPPYPSSDVAWTGGYDRAVPQPHNGADGIPQLFDRLVLANGGVTKTARSECGYNRRKSNNIREARSWSCLRNISHRRTKTAPPTSDSKQVSYLELYKRKLHSIGAPTQRRADIEKQDQQQVVVACKQNTVEEMQSLAPKCPDNTPVTNADDKEAANGKSHELHDVVTKRVNEEPCSQCPRKKQFVEDVCEFTKSVCEIETQNKKPYTKRTAINPKYLRQVPLKLGSLGFDKEAVKEKYERFKKQQCYGEQVSIRNRMKLSQTQKAHDKSFEDKKDVHIRKSNVPESDVGPQKCGQVKLEQKLDSRHKNETSKAARAKNYSETIRANTVASRRSDFKSVVLPSSNSMETIKPLVERHMKENEIVDTIRRSFGTTKLNLKP